METEDAFLKKVRIIKEGISAEALALLEDEFELDAPVFQTRDRLGADLPINNFELFKFKGIRRDGAHDVIKWIRAMKKVSPNQQREYGH